MLFDVGAEPTSFTEGREGKDVYVEKMPMSYKFDDIEIKFLPNWGFYRVGEISLNIPGSEEEIRRDVEAVKYLTERGFEKKD